MLFSEIALKFSVSPYDIESWLVLSYHLWLDSRQPNVWRVSNRNARKVVLTRLEVFIARTCAWNEQTCRFMCKHAKDLIINHQQPSAENFQTLSTSARRLVFLLCVNNKLADGRRAFLRRGNLLNYSENIPRNAVTTPISMPLVDMKSCTTWNHPNTIVS